MKKIIGIIIISSFFLDGCSSNKQIPYTDLEIARAFIKDIQENKFKEAEKFVLKEETNQQYFDSLKEFYKRKSEKELEKYRDADIVIYEQENVSDSVTIINYSNSYKKEEKNKLKVVKVDGQWMVDLKYTFSGNL